MTEERFEQLVSEGIEAIPERFLEKLRNVAVVVEEVPTQEQLKVNNIASCGSLLGLYDGVPLIDRGEGYGGLVLPDKITIFRSPVLEEAGNDENEIRRVVKETVWHEVAHYFGYNDEEIEERENRGTNFSR